MSTPGGTDGAGSFILANGRWLGGAFLLCLCSSFGQTFFISLSGGDIRRELGLSHGDFGLLYMLATLASAVTLPFLGRAIDRFSTRYVAAATILGLAAACLVMATVPSVPLLLVALYLLRLCGQGMMSQTAFTAVGRWFLAQRGRAVSYVTIGYQAGEASLPLIFIAMVGLVGWRGSWFASAAFLVAFGLPVIYALVSRERDPQGTGGTASPKTAAGDRQLYEVMRSPSFYLLCAGVVAPPFIVTTIFFHQIYLSNLRGWPVELFASGFVLMSAATAACALTCGWLIDRYTAVRVLPFFLLPLTFACFVISLVVSPVAVFIFMGLVGISNGFAATLFGALWPELYGVRHLGAIRSVVLSMLVFGSALGPGLTGFLIDRGVSYPLQIAAMGCYCLAGAIVLSLWSQRHSRSGA
ncbi:MFS transporter [Aureimonas sp. AU22]|uniref:MFS transporter n=1 Tax=Aureimonas sp. AU22 TaxID=1638162 RepID=UPI000784D3AC|nr:MFS transporter [Aureimonas sp. AU22]